MLKNEAIARNERKLCFSDNIRKKSLEIWGKFPEQLLEPQIADENTEQGKPCHAALTERDRGNRRSSFLRLYRSGILLLPCRRRNNHKLAISFSLSIRKKKNIHR